MVILGLDYTDDTHVVFVSTLITDKYYRLICRENKQKCSVVLMNNCDIFS